MFKPGMGWSVALETENGVVGLWCCWLGDRFMLGYPLDFFVEDCLIMETLKVAEGIPVSNERFGTRKWAEFFSERCQKGGRVWIGHVKSCSDSMHIDLIREKMLVNVYYGHDQSNTIENISFNFHNEKEPDAPTCDAEIIQTYQDRFLMLAWQIAQKLGRIVAVNLTVNALFCPKKLESKGYELEYIKGSKERYEGWRGTVIYTEKGEEEIMLRSANVLVPWVSVIRNPVEDLTYEKLNEILAKYLEQV